jgi:bacterioferritin
MGTKAREILGMDAGQLVEQLNKALGDEWLAYYQYWIGAKVAKGPMRGEVMSELDLHATEELGHALLLVNRIIQLGGTPLLTPESWYKVTNCGYEAPEDPYVEVLLAQNIAGEQCAIGVYKALADLTKDADPITYEMALQIMADEIEHEEDLEALQEDIQLMKERS